MGRHDYHIRTTELEGLKVHVYYDDNPLHPDEGSDDVFLVSFSNDFHIVRKNMWDVASDFSDFQHPKHKLDDAGEGCDFSDPGNEPEDSEADPVWRVKYAEACDDQIESLLLASGVDTEFENEAGRQAAGASYRERHDLWYEWQQFKKAHAEWACFELHVSNYGGGHIGLSLGDIYEGGTEDRWGYARDPAGFVMVRKAVGWHHPLEKVAQSMVDEWQHYCDGEVYGYVVEDENGDTIDSCWGFIGDIDECEQEGLNAAQAELNHRKSRMTA
jgi:hypothetical protein